MWPALIAATAAAAAVAAIHRIVARRAEAADAARPRNANGVLVGAEGFVLERAGAPAVLLLHGGGDTPQTLRALGEFLHAHGFAVAAPLLPGHGRSVRAFAHVDAAEWRQAAVAAYDALAAEHPWTGVVGLSMGGALAVLTVAERPAVPALVLLAPYVELPGGLRVAAALSRVIGLAAPYVSSQDARSIRDPEAAARGLAYGVFTPAALRGLRDTADAAATALSRVRAPTLIVQSQQDNRVAPAVATRALARLGAAEKRLEWISDGGHVITVDFGRERVYALTYAWLASHGAGALLPS
ncbi:MAG: alpha/beta fold hydrolase [Gemmatimonadota bacterium]|nr:alpha/beta fold hydrolase [Gemmatimonadota bacterium]